MFAIVLVNVHPILLQYSSHNACFSASLHALPCPRPPPAARVAAPLARPAAAFLCSGPFLGSNSWVQQNNEFICGPCMQFDLHTYVACMLPIITCMHADCLTFTLPQLGFHCHSVVNSLSFMKGLSVWQTDNHVVR